MAEIQGNMPPQLPPLFDATPESLGKDAQTIIKSTKTLWDNIVAEITPESATIGNTILPVAHNENESLQKTQVIKLYESTHPSADMRNASKEATRQVTNAEVDLYVRDDMFQLVDAVLKKTDEVSTDPETYRFIVKHHAEFSKNGCALPGPAKEKFQKDKKHLSALCKEYLANLNGDQSGIWFTPAELDGLAADIIGSLKKGEGEEEGKVWLTMKPAHFSRAMTYAKSEETRKRVMSTSLNRVPANIPLQREILLLQDSLARQQGWASWAKYKMSDKMMGKPENVLDMLELIRPQLLDHGKKEADELLKLKKSNVTYDGPADLKLMFWDLDFYRNLKEQATASVDNKHIMEYFELATVHNNLLAIYERLFDIRFEHVTSEKRYQILGDKHEAMTWQEDVLLYMVWDEADAGAFLGYIYFDLHPRLGKFTHVGQYNLQQASSISCIFLWHGLTVSQGFDKRDGTRHYPCSVLVMNYAKSSPSKPSLLSMNEVRSFFHEVGHGMHNILSLVKFARFHAPKGSDRDFSETPSILFEHFLWTPQHIREVSCHYSYVSADYRESWLLQQDTSKSLPPQYLPDDLIKGVLSVKHSNQPLQLLNQLKFSLYDLTVHNPSSREELENSNFCQVWNKLWVSLVPAHGGEALGEGWEWVHPEACVRNMYGGNDAGVYAYIM